MLEWKRQTMNESASSIQQEIDQAVRNYLAIAPDADGSALATYLTLMRLVEVLVEPGVVTKALTPAEFTLVRILFFTPSHRLALSEAAREMGVTATYVKKLTVSLEGEGWVTQVPGVEDRRVTFVELTPEGRERFRAVVPNVVSFIERCVGDLREDERKLLQELLAKLTVAVSRANAVLLEDRIEQEA